MYNLLPPSLFGSCLGLTHCLLTDQDARHLNMFTFLGTLSSFASSAAVLTCYSDGLENQRSSHPFQLYEILRGESERLKLAQCFGFSVSPS
jgi:hypothetical protein